jgi:hypothetical protein
MPQGQNGMRPEGGMPLRVRLSDGLGVIAVRWEHDASRHNESAFSIGDAPAAIVLDGTVSISVCEAVG